MKPNIQKILACIDFSDYTQMVLEHAVKLSQNAEAQILVYNVINQRDVDNAEKISNFATTQISMKEYIRNQEKERTGMIRNLIKDLFFKEKSRMSFKVDVGVPFEQILQTIDDEKIDLVVMANKGRGNLSNILFGSAAEKVFRHSPVPVASVRENKRFKREN